VTASVRFLDEAVAELEDASSWYQEQRSGLGLVFLAAADRTIDRVSRWPKTGSPSRVVALGCRDACVGLASSAFSHFGRNLFGVGDDPGPDDTIAFVGSHRNEFFGAPDLVLGHEVTVAGRSDSLG
jgi:hypothetical protein